MSVKFAKKALHRFLSDPEPEVLCIKGNWGTGKTYAWNEALIEAASNNTLAIKKYAYVSLFGIKESSDIIQSVFALADELRPAADADSTHRTFGKLDPRTKELGKKLRSLVSFTAEHVTLPHVAGLGGVARAVLSSLVSDTLVCIDDFERKGSSVSVNEIMGVIAQLRDTRRCKVVLILNEDSLSEKEREEFHQYSEKVINRTIRFLPTESESTAIAFPKTDALSEHLRNCCSLLGIVNIRIMLKMQAIAREIMSIVDVKNEEVQKSVVKSLVVLVWTSLSPVGEGAPTMSYLKNRRASEYFGIDKKQLSPEETRWNVILNDYGFTHCNELDLLMVNGIERGFFNDEDISLEIEKLLTNTARIRGETALTEAWALFHESFDDNPEEVAKQLYNGCVNNISYLTAGNLSGAVNVLKKIGFPEQAHDLLEKYMSHHNDKAVFDLSANMFAHHVQDPDVIAAFAKKAKEFVDAPPSPIEAATRISKGGWSPEDEERLAAMSVDEFVTEFKIAKGKERRAFIFGSLEFRRVSNASECQLRIAQNAKAALIKIGQESPLNALRLGAYSVKTDQPNDAAKPENDAVQS